MKEELTLDELKRLNAEEESRETEAVDSAEEDQDESDAEDNGQQAEAEEAEEADSEEAEGADAEPWMQEEEQGSEDGDDNVPLKTHISVRSKLKGKLKDKDDEIEQLKKRIEDMEARSLSPVSAQPVSQKAKPKRDDFLDEDDPESAYLEAMFSWRDEQAEAKARNAMENERMQTEAKRQKQKIDESVDRHYERAEKLIAKHGINPDAYRAADENFRSAIKAVMPTSADDVADRIISVLGDGSERVLFYVGKNESARAMVQSKLAEDNSGLSLIAYLGELKALKTASAKPKHSRAAKPAPTVKGDTVESSSEAKMKKAYNGAQDMQKRFDIRRQARAKGFNVDNW